MEIAGSSTGVISGSGLSTYAAGIALKEKSKLN
jgi:hypothetical protein